MILIYMKVRRHVPRNYALDVIIKASGPFFCTFHSLRWKGNRFYYNLRLIDRKQREEVTECRRCWTKISYEAAGVFAQRTRKCNT
jgi:hypothetical protein